MIQTRRKFDPDSIKLVIFDLDGTLIDSRLDLVHSVNAALRHIGRPELPDDVIASYVGDGAPVLIQRALGGETVDDAIVRQGLQFFSQRTRRGQKVPFGVSVVERRVVVPQQGFARTSE